MDDAGIAYQYIHIRNFGKSGMDSGSICHIAADGLRTGFQNQRIGGFMIFLIKKPNPVTPGGKQADSRGADAVGAYERFEFYEEAKKCYCILQSGETAIYANIILQKGVI